MQFSILWDGRKVTAFVSLGRRCDQNLSAFCLTTDSGCYFHLWRHRHSISRLIVTAADEFLRTQFRYNTGGLKMLNPLAA